MTTLFQQQLLLYMLLALLLPRSTYEQIRYTKATGENRINLIQVDKVVREIEERQLRQGHSAESKNAEQSIRSGTESEEESKFINRSKKANNSENVPKKNKDLQRENNELEEPMQMADKAKAKKEVDNAIKFLETKESLHTISTKMNKKSKGGKVLLTDQHKLKSITTKNESSHQDNVSQTQKRPTFYDSSSWNKEKKQFPSIIKDPTMQLPQNKTTSSQLEHFQDITQSKAGLFAPFQLHLSSSSRIKRQPQFEKPSTQSISFSSNRLPQPQAQHQSIQLNDFHSQLSLPVVPLPAPPAFPSAFSITPFGGANPKDVFKFPNAFAVAAAAASPSSTKPSCGGILKQSFGIIQTPNFPRKFSVPLECIWIIDASELSTTATASNAASFPSSAAVAPTNVTIVVYLTQLYVLGGLKFTEYMYYSDDYKVPSHRVFELTEDDVTQVASVQFNSQYLEVRFTMSSLDGTHLRALDRLLDVYGFNITYEVHHETKPYQCNTLQCRFLGHCFAHADFSSYYCACFAGFSGIDCGRGPLCEDPHTNICQNGGTCKHIGDAAITCHCPVGYKGTKCEIPEINEITMGCTANSTLNDCHQECNFDRIYADAYSSAKVGRTLARSGKTRYEVTIRLGANLTAFYRATDADRRPGDHLPSVLEKHVSKII